MRILNELCEEIVRHLSNRSDLYNLLFTDPTLRCEAQRAMLRCIDMTLPGDGASNLQISSPMINHLNETFRFLSRNILFASAIRRLIYRPTVVEDALLDLVVPRMINLRHLRIHTAPDNFHNSIHPSFLRCPCKLYAFALLGASRVDRASIGTFLKTQSTIVDLMVYKFSPSLFHGDGTLPHVTNLSFYSPTSPSLLGTVLQSRPVTRLQVRALSQLSNCPSTTLQKILVITCSRLGSDVSLPVCSSVEFLEVGATTAHALIMTLHHFPVLKVLVVPQLASSPQMIRGILATLFDACRSLCTIQALTCQPNAQNELSIFNRGLEKVGTKPCDPEQWKKYTLNGPTVERSEENASRVVLKKG